MNYTRRHFTGLVRRTDIVFDVYRSDSLKADTRKKRGKGIRIRAEAHRRLLGNWQQFLREDGSKLELFDPLCHQLAQERFTGVVIMTNGEDVCKSKAVDTEILSPCTQEEADTRMLLHAADGVKQGHKNILLRTVDTDVVVLAVSLAHKLECDRLCIAFGTGKSFHYLDATYMALMLGNDRCTALPSFHALTGCDTTSSFAGIGKRTAWSAWNAFDDVTPALCTLAQMPTAADVWQLLLVIGRCIDVWPCKFRWQCEHGQADSLHT